MAPLTELTAYVSESPEQRTTSPLMDPGWSGMLFTVTVSVLAGDEPHMLLAVTEIFSLVGLTVALIEVVVDVPVQPLGKVQV